MDAEYFIVELLKDDGAIVYLNGTEIVRANMPYGMTSSQTTALSSLNGEEETRFLFYPLDKQLLHAGENLVAVEIHQYNGSSSDLGFNLGITALHLHGQSIIVE